MSKLPNLSSKKPIYKLTLPSNGTEISYSPYTKEQQKSILISSQEKEISVLINQLNAIISDCTNQTKIDKLVDFTYVIAHLHTVSHGGHHTFVQSECECGHKNIQISVENILDHIKIKNKENVKDVYQFRDNYALKLSPPKIKMLETISGEETPENYIKQMYSLIANSIDAVIEGNSVYSDFETDELIENIIKHLTPAEIDEISKKLNEMISVVFEVKYTCPACFKEFTTEMSDFLF